MHPRARQLIQELDLQPHPEGGLYRQLHRSETFVTRSDGVVRAALTTIFFLLPAQAFSRWHRVSADEVWHYYEGDDLELQVLEPGCTEPAAYLLGRVASGVMPVRIVCAGAWQAARSMGDYTLVGCTVAPGFEFEDFILLEDIPLEQRPASLR